MLGFRRYWIASVVVLGAVSGCSDDDTPGQDGGELDTEHHPETAGGDDSGDSEGATGGASTGGASTGGGESSGGESGSDGGKPGDWGEEICGDIDCGAGTCVPDPEGSARCECDPGHADVGLRCVPCEVTEGVFDVDVPVVTLSGRVTVAGAEPPSSPYDYGEISLRVSSTGDRVALTETRSPSYSVAVIAGRYELAYETREGGEGTPVNTDARLAVVDVGPTANLDVDVPMVTVQRSITFDGVDPPESAYETARILLRAGNRDEVDLGSSDRASATVAIVPGRYTVHYAHERGGEVVPINPDARLGEVVIEHDAAAPPTDPIGLAIDVPTARIDGRFSINGADPPSSVYDAATIALSDPGGGGELLLGNTADGTFSAMVVRTSYEVHYHGSAASSIMPRNGDAILGSIDLQTRPTFDIDILAVTLSGSVTIAGQAPSAEAEALLVLRDPGTDDVVPIGSTHDATVSGVVIPASYDLYYRQEGGAAEIPANTNTRLGELDATNPVAVTVDVPSVRVSGVFTVEGLPPPPTAYDDGRIYLKNTDTGDSVLLGNTRLGQFDRLVTPGDYEIRYSVEVAGTTLPRNGDVLLGTTSIVSDSTLDVDVPAMTLAGTITFSGSMPPKGAYDRGRLLLEDTKTGDVIFLASTTDDAFVQPLVPGTYVVLYEVEATSGLAPANTRAAFACVDLRPPT